MLDINEYITKSLNERQEHLDLSLECIEIGGNSTQFRGLLAYLLKTTIPKGSKIHLCHACNNDKCCNHQHLYWGTASENSLDRIKHTGITAWDNSVAKYGLDNAKIKASKSVNRAACSKGGKKSKGKPKSYETRLKLSRALKGKKQNRGRVAKMDETHET